MSYAGTFPFTVRGTSGVITSDTESSLTLNCTEEGGGGGDCTVLEYGLNTSNIIVSPDPNSYIPQLCFGVTEPPLPSFSFSFDFTLVRNCDGVFSDVETGSSSCTEVTVLGSNISCTTIVLTSQGDFEVMLDYSATCT